MNLTIRFWVTALTSRLILGAGTESLSCDRLRMLVSEELRQHHPKHPDYVVKLFLSQVAGEATVRNRAELITHAFQNLSSLIETQGHTLSLKTGGLGEWQEVICRVPCFWLTTHAIGEKLGSLPEARDPDFVYLKKLTKLLSHCSFPAPKLPQLERLIADEGLTELHMHLSGTSEDETIWQHALISPEKFSQFVRQKEKQSATELYLSHGDESWALNCLNHLKNARRIRARLCLRLFGKPPKCGGNPDFETIAKAAELLPHRTHPAAYIASASVRPNHHRTWEAYFILHALAYLKKHPNQEKFAEQFHHYLLLRADFQLHLVQQEDQWGFDQFQKITLTGMRDLLEDDSYRERFDQLSGREGRDLGHIEARFSPKDSSGKQQAMVHQIVKGYLKSQGALSRARMPKLTLVAHLIKSADKKTTAKKILSGTKSADGEPKPISLTLCRHQTARTQYLQRMRVLLHTTRYRVGETSIKINDLLCGLDAASNELDAPPEVFAPSFRRFRHARAGGFTYHVGEDFIHLISGIRAVHEAIHLLELKSGDRLGHAISVGIRPLLWLERSPSEVRITRQEWLDNLIFCWDLLKDLPGSPELARLDADARFQYTQIYGVKKLDHQPVRPLEIAAYRRSMQLRGLDAALNLHDLDSLDGRIRLNPFDQAEADNLLKVSRNEPVAFAYLQAYHEAHHFAKASEIISVPANYLNESLLITLQVVVLKMITSLNLAIEVPPTSNVRISFYRTHDEHHFGRWLGYDDLHKNEPKPTMVLCTDDPGIFATNLRIEYAHVFEVLTRCYKKSATDAGDILERLHKNAQEFKFRAPVAN